VDLTSPPDTPPRLWTLRLELPLVRRVLRLGVWVMLAVITQFFVNAADTFMVGRLEAKTATASQAALGLGMPLFWGVGGFFAAVSFGTQALVARRYAAGDHRAAGAVLWNALWIALAAGLLGGALGHALVDPAMGYFAEASEAQRRLGADYTRIRMLGIPGMVLTFAYKAFYDGIGRTYVHLWAALAMNLFNIGLNYLLIFGSAPLGIPALELRGAGIASVTSTYLGLLIIAAVSLRRADRRRFRAYRPANFDPAAAARIVRLMLPSGSATVILMGGFLLFMRFVGMLDAGSGANTYTAAAKAIMDTAALCFMPLLAFGTATATCVSQSLGAGKPNLAARYGWEAVRLGIYAMGAVMAAMLLWPEPILAFWAPNDPAVATEGANALRTVAVSLPLMVVGLVLSQALYGAGANLFVMLVELTLHVGVLVPASYLFGPVLGGGLEGVFAAAALYIALLGAVMGWKFATGSWRRIRL